jgi:hypothetical protein
VANAGFPFVDEGIDHGHAIIANTNTIALGFLPSSG